MPLTKAPKTSILRREVARPGLWNAPRGSARVPAALKYRARGISGSALKERRFLAVGEQHLRPLHSARRLASRARNRRQPANLLIGHRQLDHLPPSCHDTLPRSVKPKRGIHEQI